ncbi:Deoxyribodipyrimidine photo-lyase [Aliarcobacter thereius]|uniref:Deoxyribodipyrimidine photo-lyase n=2 Tax=Aliarcobacter thereius TaxID=544718 RepID=A0A5R9H3S8_9BACT|nr:deoxyribodipyrimidine photo-lyase [Aliarcobacter thereius]OCL86907.1 Deoxyribodipyrimidine photo-lyase [Aliarcobacter thereius]OCL91088.1 Deoxyribodipyrimidine photo-lyase [Aliarcobacter thereius]OCL96059.1 Deoxyribodipyrimidine photo-lyase [Aliarcobacter thereius LMG 24486]QBF15969.1 deoxyribodipyrimidine photolyase [Aliarcobacter thereius LMG 24486]TLS71968.1 deoxyribodipyrimidine photo-lyase [Aliarcobacter thereius]
MKQILWFRRDLRVDDNAILSNAKDEVLAIFIFDKNILNKLEKDDKRVTFIYQSVLELKKNLQKIGLDLAIFYETPKDVFTKLKKDGFDEILTSIDFDDYAKKRDDEISNILPIKRFIDSFLIDPKDILKPNKTPYKLFTAFYNSLEFLHDSNSIKEFEIPKKLKKIDFNYNFIPTLEDLGFIKQKLPNFLYRSADELIDIFSKKIQNYQKDRDYFYLDASSNLSVHLRFGLISPRTLFNRIKKLNSPKEEIAFYIRELFWREFYNYILYYFPKSQFENLNGIEINWNENEEDFIKWCKGETGVPIIDASMKYLNQTGLMHNRLRMIVSSYLTKNLLIDWKKGEKYFALKLLDYEASSNIGSWQWAASTGVDSVPYFRVFNPYLQSKKFDKDAVFIKSVLEELKDISPKIIHIENGIQENIFLNYPRQIVGISYSRNRAIFEFKKLKPFKI